VAVKFVPQADCEGAESTTVGSILVLVLTVALSLAAAVAAVVRLVALSRERDLRGQAAPVAIVIGLVLVGTLFVWPDAEFIWRFALSGLVVTGGLLAILLLCLLTRRSPAQAGALVPLYLAGGALFAYPAVALAVWLASSGVGC
jgi:cyanate permease